MAAEPSPADYFARQGWNARIAGKERHDNPCRGSAGADWRRGYDARVAAEKESK